MKLYALLREDLQMPPGKACSQAAHAYLGSFLQADSSRQSEYHKDGIGTKICLSVKSLEDLLIWQGWARTLGLPHFLVEDSGRNTTFGGVSTISALGVGPLTAEESQGLRKLQLLR